MSSRESSAAEDAALLSAVRNGDERAFGTLYARFSGPVYSLLMKMLQNQQDAEEVLQAAFLQIWHKASGFDPQRSNFFTFLVLIARGKAFDRLRQRNRHARVVDEATRAEHLAPPELAQSGSQEVHQHETQVAVLAALNSLSPDQRHAIELAFFSGMSQNEIAENLAEPLGTVKARIRRGMLRLRDTLTRRL